MKLLKGSGNVRDPARIKELLSLLEQIWNYVPDWRFNQLISNLQMAFHQKTKRGTLCFNYEKNPFGMLEARQWAVDLFHIEDDEFIKFLKEYLEKLQKQYEKGE